jgi:hypothetical protein
LVSDAEIDQALAILHDALTVVLPTDSDEA